jgi:tetratricopeptide (TPR) repeat protein
MQDERRSLESLRQEADSRQPSRLGLSQLAFSHKRIGALLIHDNRLDEALREYQAGLALDERAAAGSPADPLTAFNRTFAYNDVGLIYKLQGNLPKALEYYRKALAIRETQAAADSSDVRARQSVARSLSSIAFVLSLMGNFDGALHARLRAIAILDDFAPANLAFRKSLADEEAWTGDELSKIAMRSPAARRNEKWRGARDHYRRAYDLLKALKPDPAVQKSLKTASDGLAQCAAHLRTAEGAPGRYNPP